jgi:hypothetical protein
MADEPRRQKTTGQTEPGPRQLPGDPLTWFTAALVLMWAGVVLLAKNTGEVLGVEVQYASAWILTGTGVLLWIEAILRLAIPACQQGVDTRIILGTVFVIIGLGEVVTISLWPILLIVIGISMIVGFFVYPRRS